jgi:putative spermidine/putrescine transport system permease protein
MRGAALSLLPVLTLLTLLFGGGLGIAFLQSVGYFAPAAEQSFTLTHYGALLFDEEMRTSILVTLLWSAAATALSTIVGIAAALALRRLAKASRMLSALLQIPIALPHLAMAILALNVLGQSGLIARVAYKSGLIDAPAGFPEFFHDRYGVGIVLTYALKEAPFIALVALAMLRRAGAEYESLAATLGAGKWQRFRYVTLPLMAAPVISASLIVFAFIFGSFEVPFLLGRPYPAMLGVLIQRRFLSTDLADRPGAIAAGILMSAISAMVVLAYLRLSSRLVGERPTLF